MEMGTIGWSQPYFRGLDEGTVLAMPDIGSPEVRLAFVKIVLLCLFWSMIVSWVWLIWRMLTGQPILPERPLVSRGPIPWRAGTVFLIFVSFIIVQEAGALGIQSDSPISRKMLFGALVDLFMLIVVPVVARFTCRARLRDFGLSFDGGWRQAGLGVVATFIAAPPVIAIQAIAIRIWDPNAHPVQEMIFKEFSFGVAVLAVGTAVVVAPLFEELAFRGLIQSWVVAALLRSARRRPSDGVVVNDAPGDTAADPGLATTDWQRETAATPVNPFESPKVLDSPQTLELSDAGPMGYAWLGVVLTSLLFGAVHFAQWPAPVALFALALVIGTVYQRTGSLIAAVSMHATFNGLNTLLLFLAVLSGQKLEPDKLTREDSSEQIRCVKMEKTQNVPVYVGHRA
jgi:membrane protease YdiL (CAAX protease family)